MSQSHLDPDPVDIVDRPVCPRCGTHMWLLVIEPDSPGHDRRTFQCPECEYEKSVVVRYR
jgi:tRNA(Ile2) C34 agmatinyltransferase TiaS